ncbi:hypothetical protein ACFP9V_11600 [Deinococcus radiopugnans]|uniref:Lipoprotein n=1 Tax=Deinococcus radiopugnans ATCC 19172 TaxID=585398 RepID=A0A5C4Y8W1_9DEIO|nr:hypothetical protein [Deinococcus radiopugnans]MBB6015956.1 hypothetical protein [Deinococcus radiopugnans ATCC 19172]TNM72352.1 hypothetical protein FHR04_03380 [Deinococcus radiopugnans ATCC 19172]
MRSLPVFSLMLPLLLGACKNGPDTGQLTSSAEIFLGNGGASLFDTSARSYGRPCLDGLNLNSTQLGGGGLFGDDSNLIRFIEKHKLANTFHAPQPNGTDLVTLMPIAPYEANWSSGQAGFSSFCFGKITLIKAEAVPDAKPITAGASEPYIIQGTEAISTRLTFKLTDVPAGDFVADLKERPSLLARGAMKPDDYGQELTVVVPLPLKPENFVPAVNQNP